MATKAKPKSKSIKKAARRASAASKTVHLKAKSAKSMSANGSRNGSKPAPKDSSRRASKSTRVESRRTAVVAASSPSRSTSPQRARSKHFENAIQAYEAGIKLMHAEEFEKAIRCFQDLIVEHSEEAEIQERAKVLLHACE